MQAIPPKFVGNSDFGRLLAFSQAPFAGNRGALPEKGVNAQFGSPTLAFGRGEREAARELTMAGKQATKNNLRGKVGSILLVTGATVLVVYSAALAWQFQAALSSANNDAFGLLGNVGMASLRAVRVVVFDHSVMVLVARRILVLCSALMVTLIGIALLPKREARTATLMERNVSTRSEGGR